MRHHSITKRLFTILSFLLSAANPCNSQDNMRFEHFTSENGLSENFVYTVYQDKKGYLWIGTHDGLNRYDGYGFKKFRHDPANSNSLPDNTIYSICEDKEGNLWIGTNAGLCKYDPSTEVFTTITLNKKLRAVEQVILVNDKELMLRHERRLCLINTRTQKEIPLNYKDSSGLNTISYSRCPITKDKQGNIYTVKQGWGNARILKYEPRNRFFTEIVTLAVPEKFPLTVIGYLYIDSHNLCWLGVSDLELHNFDLSLNNIKKDRPLQPVRILTTNAIKHIFEDNKGNTWIASNAGLIYLDKASEKTYWYKQDNKITSSISSDDVQHIFQDRTGIIWIATSNGLNKLNPSQKKFRHLTRAQNINDGLYNNFVLGIFQEGNEQLRIHYNIYNNLHFTRYHIRNKSFKHIAHSGYDPAAMIREVFVQNPERLTNEILRKVIATFEKNNGVSWRDKLGAKIWIDDQQQLWSDMGSLNSNPYWLFDTAYVDMHLYGKDLWIASSKGLIQINTLTKASLVYSVDGSGRNSISSNDITCFVFEGNGNMWIGTKGGGLNYFDRQKNKFYHYTEKDGLCNNSIYCMVKDDNGRLWIGTSIGLSNFDPATRKFKNYFRADGLINNEYNRKSACKMTDGTIFMGGMDGIDFFHPDSLVSNENKPPVQITDFKIFNQSIYPGKLAELELKHDQNFISIEFAAMDFNNPAANKFAYKLEGADKDWIILEGRNFTTYSYLPPGRYRFLVKAANRDGVWNEEPAIFQFTILPAWYQTGWFIVLVITAIAVAIYALFRYRLQQKLRVLQIRNRLHRDLHDDIGATLSSVKAYSEILKDNPDNPIIAELIERLEVIAWATNPQHDHFKSLKNRMLKFAAPLCHSKNIQCHIESKGVNEEMLMAGEIRQNIFLVFKEAINNMIKYAEATKCSTNISISNNQFVLQIADNGKGFDGTIKGTGSGWKNMQKRTGDLNGKLVIDSTPQKGTVISMSLPYPFKIPNTWDGNKS
jgi:ligand-binding sensor domain-containing protein